MRFRIGLEIHVTGGVRLHDDLTLGTNLGIQTDVDFGDQYGRAERCKCTRTRQCAASEQRNFVTEGDGIQRLDDHGTGLSQRCTLGLKDRLNQAVSTNINQRIERQNRCAARAGTSNKAARITIDIEVCWRLLVHLIGRENADVVRLDHCSNIRTGADFCGYS